MRTPFAIDACFTDHVVVPLLRLGCTSVILAATMLATNAKGADVRRRYLGRTDAAGRARIIAAPVVKGVGEPRQTLRLE